jgi:hypothetical protein
MAFAFIKDRHEMFVITTNAFTRINVKWRKWDMAYEQDNVLGRLQFANFHCTMTSEMFDNSVGNYVIHRIQHLLHVDMFTS